MRTLDFLDRESDESGAGAETGTNAPENVVDAAPGAEAGGETPAAAVSEPEPVVTGGEEGDPADYEGFKKALAASREDTKAEKKRRREVERELAEFRGKLSVYQQQQQPQAQATPAEEPIDLTEENFFDPEAVKAYVAHREQRLEQKYEAKFEALEQQRMMRSAMRARAKHEDFDEKLKAFDAIAPDGSQLQQQAKNHHDPAEFVYRYMADVEATQGADSVEDLKEKLRAEIRAEEAAKQAGAGNPAPAPATSRPAIPKSIANARGSGAGVKPEWSGRRELDFLQR